MVVLYTLKKAENKNTLEYKYFLLKNVSYV